MTWSCRWRSTRASRSRWAGPGGGARGMVEAARRWHEAADGAWRERQGAGGRGEGAGLEGRWKQRDNDMKLQMALDESVKEQVGGARGWGQGAGHGAWPEARGDDYACYSDCCSPMYVVWLRALVPIWYPVTADIVRTSFHSPHTYVTLMRVALLAAAHAALDGGRRRAAGQRPLVGALCWSLGRGRGRAGGLGAPHPPAPTARGGCSRTVAVTARRTESPWWALDAECRT